jgi:hypothetical protein
MPIAARKPPKGPGARGAGSSKDRFGRIVLDSATSRPADHLADNDTSGCRPALALGKYGATVRCPETADRSMHLPESSARRQTRFPVAAPSMTKRDFELARSRMPMETWGSRAIVQPIFLIGMTIWFHHARLRRRSLIGRSRQPCARHNCDPAPCSVPAYDCGSPQAH